MKVVRYNSDHYEVVKEWARHYPNITLSSKENIPYSSFLIEDNGDFLIFLMVVFTNTSVMLIDDLIGNPEIRGPRRREGTQMGLEELKRIAKENSFKSVMSFCPNESLAKYYKSLGFRMNENKTTLCYLGVE